MVKVHILGKCLRVHVVLSIYYYQILWHKKILPQILTD